MSFGLEYTCKLRDKFLAADIFDGRLEKFDLREGQWESESGKQWAARHRRRRVSDGEDGVTVEVELDGSVGYVGYSWRSNSGQGNYPDILEKFVKALNTEAETVYCVTDDDLMLLNYCADHGIDSGLECHADDPLRHEKWIEWKHSDRYDRANDAVNEHIKKRTPPSELAEQAPVANAPEGDAGSASEDLSDELPF
jgi:hypothetical protein